MGVLGSTRFLVCVGEPCFVAIVFVLVYLIHTNVLTISLRAAPKGATPSRRTGGGGARARRAATGASASAGASASSSGADAPDGSPRVVPKPPAR